MILFANFMVAMNLKSIIIITLKVIGLVIQLCFALMEKKQKELNYCLYQLKFMYYLRLNWKNRFCYEKFKGAIVMLAFMRYQFTVSYCDLS